MPVTHSGGTEAAMSYTFDGLNIGRSGIQAARGNLNITGQNITNVNTDGYTRQRVNQSAMAPSSLGMMYSSGSVVYGEGVEIKGIEQMRDAFLDGECRSQNAVTGSASTINDALQYIEQVFYTTGSDGTDEDSTSIVDVLNSQYGKFVSQLESLTASSNTSNESNVLSAAKNLATAFNTASKALETAWKQQYTNLTDYAVKDVNGLLKNIAGLNDQIKSSELAGAPALELLDKRNLDIDKLSQYCNIKVTEDTDYVGDKEIHTMHIQLIGSDGKPVTFPGKGQDDSDPPKDIDISFTGDLINGDQYSQFSVVPKPEDAKAFDKIGIDISMPAKDGKGIVVTEQAGGVGHYTYPSHDFAGNITTGEFGGYLQLLNESGELDDNKEDLRGIGYYKKLLDNAAKGFADIINKANSTSDDGTINKPLFTSDGDTGITAGNIRTASGWVVDKDHKGYLTFTKEAANPGDSKDASFSNITDMVETLNKSDVSNSLLKIGKTLGIEIDSKNSDYTSKNSVLNKIKNNRESLSSVDIDDETVNLIKFNQALAASARFLTTVDECINTLINNTGVAGR